MRVIPAIDLLGGRVVRLREGDYARATSYARDPLEVVAGFAEAGATRVHVVDLDAARGLGENGAVVRALVEATRVEVQVGGGVRDEATAASWLEGGATCVVLGTVAVENPELTERIATRWPGRVFVAVDARGDEVAVRGWLQDGGMGVLDLVRRYAGTPVAGFIYTQIDRDGMMSGHDADRLALVVTATAHPVVASGGVSSVADVRAADAAGAWGAIVGRALYEGTTTLSELLAAV